LRSNLLAQQEAVDRGDRLGFYALDLAFHEILVTGLDLPRVAAVIEASRANIDRVRRLLSSPRRHAVTLAEHRALLEALEAGDPQAARRAMEAHLDAVMEELERFSATRPEVFIPF
jgi:DNA-binding GntR family transcriptional regulator